MELAAAVFSGVSAAVSAVGSAVGTAASAVGTAASAVGLGSTGGSFLTSLLAGGVGLMGALSAKREGEARAAQLQEQAADAGLDARAQELAGLQKTDRLRRALIAEQGERDVAYAASGVDLSFGTPATARQAAADDAARAIGVEAADTEILAGRYRQRAAGYRRQAAEAKIAGRWKAAGMLGETALSIVRRG